MFSLKVIDTDLFMDMPQTTQLLYFNLAMRADDDGFISNPKKILRLSGCSDDDMKILVAKQFLIPFESGVCVIRHWRVHNIIRQDRYQETECSEERKMLTEKEGKYLLNLANVIPSGNQAATKRQPRLGKDRLGEDRSGESKQEAAQSAAEAGDDPKNGVKQAPRPDQDIVDIIDEFRKSGLNPHIKFGLKGHRDAAAELARCYGIGKALQLVRFAAQAAGRPYAPLITTPRQLLDKYGALQAFAARIKVERTVGEPIT